MAPSLTTVRGLERYHRILTGESRAHHDILRRIPVDIDSEADLTELWREHDVAMAHYRELLTDDDALTVLTPRTNNLLGLKLEICHRLMHSCKLCENRCAVDRNSGELGKCRCGREARIASRFIHMHEEMELVPSLTVFFSGCNARCCFCQNWDISQDSFSGIVLTGEEIGRGLDEYHELGVKNVNWVGGEPTPHIHTVISSLLNSKSSLPVVWNSNMYLSREAMALLSGVVDIYLTDFKFGNDDCAVRYSGMEDYWETVTRNHISASQDAEILIRHLVLPDNLECCSIPILKWVAENLGPGTRVNVMGQYRPAGDTGRCEELQRRLQDSEISYILDSARNLGLDNIV